jgi:hypothetical protein
VEMELLPEKVQKVLKKGIFNFSSESLQSFFEVSTAMGYNWVKDDSEHDKRERVLNNINEFCQMRRSPSRKRTFVQLVRNFVVLGVSRESLPLSVQDSLSHSFSTLSSKIVEKLKQR